mgnify:CR=1 FL=1
MLSIRTTKTASGATAVQVVRYERRAKVIVAHLGSAHTNKELQSLKIAARSFIDKQSKQRRLLKETAVSRSTLIALDKCRYIGMRYSFLYETLHRVGDIFSFHTLRQPLLIDLVVMRLMEPASKLRSLELLEEYFGVSYHRQGFYRTLKACVLKKDAVEQQIVTVAKQHFGFDFTVVFYDVTTLYFESFSPDDLRKPGFSKDNKSNQPQIVIGLVVTPEGFPVAYEIFAGNTFEGNTFIPVIVALKKKHRIETLTVVADAAMISHKNIEELTKNGLRYIVGARMGNLSSTIIATVTKQLSGIDGATTRLATGSGDLICGFSLTRFRKDKREMDKQVNKAEYLLKMPGSVKRTKFLKNSGSAVYELNQGLMKKTESLLGMKGYYTNLDKDIGNDAIIAQYRNLWHVEQAFRVAKSDLETRPIFHRKEDAIKTHILICFMALAMAKYLEIKSNRSIHAIIKTMKQITDARILNTLTHEVVALRMEIPEETKEFLKQIGVWY